MLHSKQKKAAAASGIYKNKTSLFAFEHWTYMLCNPNSFIPKFQRHWFTVQKLFKIQVEKGVFEPMRKLDIGAVPRIWSPHPVYDIKTLWNIKLWPNKDASWRLGSTCDFVWPGPACTCVDLRWLALTLVEFKFARKSTQVSHRLATYPSQRKLSNVH